MKYPEKWTVKHEMTIRLKIAAVTHAILLLQKINISRSIHTTHVQRGFFDEKCMTRKYFNGKCQEIQLIFFFSWLCIQTSVTCLWTLHIHTTYFFSFYIVDNIKDASLKWHKFHRRICSCSCLTINIFLVLNVEVITKTTYFKGLSTMKKWFPIWKYLSRYKG